MKTEALSHVCSSTDIHPCLIMECASLWMGLGPGGKQKECLDEMNRFSRCEDMLRSNGINSL